MFSIPEKLFSKKKKKPVEVKCACYECFMAQSRSSYELAFLR